jgi:hypothetical protein
VGGGSLDFWESGGRDRDELSTSVQCMDIETYDPYDPAEQVKRTGNLKKVSESSEVLKTRDERCPKKVNILPMSKP